MPLRSTLASLWRTIRRGRQLDADLDAELDSHLDALTERHVASGLTPDEARRAARLDIGGMDYVKEEVRDVRVGRIIEDTIRDVSHAWRGLLAAPGFTIATIATLSLGVGSITAIFSVTNALLLQPLPFRDPSRLVFVWADQTAEGYPRAPLSGPELKDLDERTARFDGFGAIWATTAALTGEGDPEQLRVGFVTTDYFSVLGADAFLGRTFEEGDDSIAAPTSILLSGAVWQRRYGSDPTIVGRRIDVNGRPMTVVGVMPVGFRLMMPPDAAVPDDLEAWLPLNRRFPEGPRGQRYLRVVGRMRDGVSLADGRDDVDRVGREISAEHAFYGAAGRSFETQALHDDATRDVRTPLVALSIGVGILLLIACVNVAGLLVARAAARSRETAVKLALGATRGRLVRQHVVESLLLAALGGAGGLLLGTWGLSVLLALTPDALSRVRLASVDLTVAAVAWTTVLVWSALLAAAPVSEALRGRLAASIQLDGRRAGHSLRHGVRSALTIAQIALSVILVAGALLLIRTFINIQQVDAGFRADGVLTFRVALPGSRYPNQEAFNAFSRRLQTALSEIPGTTGASAMSHVPFDRVPNWGGPYVATRGADTSTAPQADYRAVAPGLMELIDMRLVEGRTFTEADDHLVAPVVIVDERLANRTWPGESAVGRQLAVDPTVVGTPETWATVVGVVRHVRHHSLVSEIRDQVYYPERQVPRNPAVYLVKTGADPAALVGPVRDVVRALDPQLPIYDVRLMRDYVEDALAIRRFTALLAVIFAAAAVVLACVGVYGVIAYSVTERYREIGVRIALGARWNQVVRLVLREGVRLLLAGGTVGLTAAGAAAWWLRSQLFGVTAWDPLSFGATLTVIAAAALAACIVPAIRALGTNPVDALRGV